MRRLDLTFSALQIPADIAALLLAALSGYNLRHAQFFTEVRPLLQTISFERYFSFALGFVAVWLLIFAISGLYSTFQRRFWNEFGRILVASTAGTMLVIAAIFFGREFTASRFLVLAMWGLSIFFVSCFRLLLRRARYSILKRKIGHQAIVIIGQNETANELASVYNQKPTLGYTVIKQFKTWNDTARKEVLKLQRAHSVDAILLADPTLDNQDASNLVAFTEEHHLTFRYLADLFTGSIQRIEISTDGGIPVIEAKRTPLDGWGRIAKRGFDVVLSLLILILASPILLICSLALVLEDGWPFIFKNTRIGERGNEFELYKLRSMWRKVSIGSQFKNQSANLALEKQLIQEKSIKEGPVYKIANDPRVTPVGAFIRRWSIDELPQFINVLKGEMSITGPRPHQPREVEKYESHHRFVFAIKPGITGMAQISGRSDLTFEDEIRLDSYYINNWSLGLDLYILLKTPIAVIMKKGAY